MSSRARITPTSFVNTYEWGNFRGDPRVRVCSASLRITGFRSDSR